MERGRSFVVVTTVMILFASSELCSSIPLNPTDTANHEWDGVNKTTNFFFNQTKPDNQNQNQPDEGYVNATLLEPTNLTISENKDERKHENSSNLVLNSDSDDASLTDGLNAKGSDHEDSGGGLQCRSNHKYDEDHEHPSPTRPKQHR